MDSNPISTQEMRSLELNAKYHIKNNNINEAENAIDDYLGLDAD